MAALRSRGGGYEGEEIVYGVAQLSIEGIAQMEKHQKARACMAIRTATATLGHVPDSKKGEFH
jgi:hypothetical protein